MLQKHYWLLFLLLCFAQQGFSQHTAFQKGYYIFPIKTGQENFLSGTMGELRSNHFHAGLDIKTENREGLIVSAAAQGYVYRIKVSSFGYGKALYIRHPNGQRTVYAHLQKFNSDIEKYVIAQQYKQERFSVNLYPPKNLFQFKKGAQIALSGNTGSSGGAHLHWEVRNENDEPLNPVKFYFKELTDTKKPYLQKVAIQPFNMSSKAEGKFENVEYVLTKGKNGYTTKQIINAYGWIGISFLGYDKMNYTNNKYGINKVTMEVNGKEIFRYELQQVSYNDMKYINVFTDYGKWKKERKVFVKCYQDKGNKLPIYKTDNAKGKIFIEDNVIYNIRIKLYDSFENSSEIRLTVKGKKDFPLKSNKKNNQISIPKTTIYNNILKVVVNDSIAPKEAAFYVNHQPYRVKKDYQEKNSYSYLWDLDLGIPKSFATSDTVVSFNIVQKIPVNKAFIYYNEIADISFPKNALFQEYYLEMGKKSNYSFFVGNRETPLHKEISITFKPKKIPVDKKKYHIYKIDAKNEASFLGGNWENNRIQFRTKTFGEFELLKDSIPPQITLLQHNYKTLRFRISDELSDIGTYKAFLNGAFLLMKYDHRKKEIWAERKNKSQVLKGDFVLTLTDEAGNVEMYQRKL